MDRVDWLDSTTRQEGVLVPHVVRCCVEEVERRGMDEEGIYRISGAANDITELKAAFNSSKAKIPFRLPPLGRWTVLSLHHPIEIIDPCRNSEAIQKPSTNLPVETQG